MKKNLLLFCFLVSGIFGYAQQDVSLFGLEHLVLNNKVNPAHSGDATFSLSLFPLSYNVYSNGPSYRDFIGQQEGNGQNVLTYPADKLAFGKENLLRVGNEIETFRFIYTQKNWSINAHHASKVNGLANYSGALAAVAINGNAGFIGQTIPLDTDVEFFSYEELGIGGAVDLGKIKIGGRVKYLSGHSAIATNQSRFSLHTDEEIYQLTLDTDIEFNAASSDGRDFSQFNFGPISYQTGSNQDAIVNTGNFLFDVSDDLFNFSGNSGIAFDLGINWQINDKLSLDVSALDLGKINWTEGAKQFKANESFEFDGLSLGTLTFDGDETISFDNAQDSLDIIQFTETNQDFSTTLPAQFYIGLAYQLNDKWRLNGTFYQSTFNNNSFTAAALGANVQIHPAFNLGATLTTMNEEAVLVGLNATVQAGPVQVFALTDNILGVFQPAEGRTLNARIGLGLEFGDK